MTTKNKISFKINKPTGNYKSFFNTNLDIKCNNIIIGNSSDNDFKLRLIVIKKDILEDGNKNCSWKWITLSKEFKSFDEIKFFI